MVRKDLVEGKAYGTTGQAHTMMIGWSQGMDEFKGKKVRIEQVNDYVIIVSYKGEVLSWLFCEQMFEEPCSLPDLKGREEMIVI